MATGRVPTTANSPLTAKGDLFGYSTTQARVPVGNDGETLVADSSASVGLRYNPQNALANPIINGGMDIWQRGTSIAVGAGAAYTSDRWMGFRGGAVAGETVSRQSVSDSTNLPSIQYCARVQRDSGNTSTGYLSFSQNLESVNSIPYAGKTVTISFYARKGANFSSASDVLTSSVYTGTGTDQTWVGGYTGTATPITQNNTLTTTWQRFAMTGTLAATTTEFAINFFYTPVGTAGAADYFEVTGVQVDLGTYTASSAPTFRRSGGTLAGELAACQRYYWRTTADGSNTYMPVGQGISNSATDAMFYIKLPQRMRIKPSTIGQANLCISDLVNYNLALTSIAWTQSSEDMIQVQGISGTGATQYRPAFLRANNSSTAYLEVSAEL